MPIFKRLAVFLFFIDLLLPFGLLGVWFNRGHILENFPMAVAIEPSYNEFIVFIALNVSIVSVFVTIIAYILKNEKLSKVMLSLAIIMTISNGCILCSEAIFAKNAEKYYNLVPIESTQIDINLKENLI